MKKRLGKAKAAEIRKHQRNDERAEIAKVKGLVAEIPPHVGLTGERRRLLKKFSDLPLSNRTMDGLASAGYSKLTPVQSVAIPQVLRGVDALVAAPTGSGKTLAFVVPVVDMLWREKWSSYDGLGAVILTPTRELGVQIFEVVSAIIRNHFITAALVIGGKDINAEQKHIAEANILIATPGRLLQHMDESVDFNLSNLKILVIDEADRVLDLGFERTLTAILNNLPSQRQTVLFSATQTKSVKALMKLSMTDPQYIAIKQLKDEKESTDAREETDYTMSSTPKKLTQFYSITPEAGKLSTLYSFITSHLNSKMLVFLTSCKQVRFTYEVLRRLRPGTPLLHLFGRMKLAKRAATYTQFSKAKSACLFATDVAARGLDFPSVDWVVQYDCADSMATYIHRVGRTARYTSSGKAVILLLPSETKFVERLQEAQIPIKKMRIKETKLVNITPKIASIVAENMDVKHLAQRALISYVKAVHLFADKEVFNAKTLKAKDLAVSFGLATAPTLKFKDSESRVAPGVHTMGLNIKNVEKRKSQNEFGYRPQERKDDLFNSSTRVSDDDDSNEYGGDLLTLKRTGTEISDVESTAVDDLLKIAEMNSAKKPKVKRKKMKLDESGIVKDTKGTHKRFDNGGDGDVESNNDFDGRYDDVQVAVSSDDETQEGDFVTRVQTKLKTQDVLDRHREKERVKEKHRYARRKRRRETDMEPADDLEVMAAEEDVEVDDLAAEGDTDFEKIVQWEEGADEDEAMKILSANFRF